MNIIINAKNQERIEKELSIAQNNCNTCIINLDDIEQAIYAIEQRLSNILYKEDWEGLKIIINVHARDFPQRYKGIPDSTHVTVERMINNWKIIEIYRAKCVINVLHLYNIDIKKDQIIDHLKKNF